MSKAHKKFHWLDKKVATRIEVTQKIDTIAEITTYSVRVTFASGETPEHVFSSFRQAMAYAEHAKKSFS